MKLVSNSVHDTLCLGKGNETERLCIDDMQFNMVTKIEARDWQQIFYDKEYATNGIFGLGMHSSSINN